MVVIEEKLSTWFKQAVRSRSHDFIRIAVGVEMLFVFERGFLHEDTI